GDEHRSVLTEMDKLRSQQSELALSQLGLNVSFPTGKGKGGELQPSSDFMATAEQFKTVADRCVYTYDFMATAEQFKTVADRYV
ncbi:hypothetical protein KIPB_013402, partial [Kipferlia bialata]